MRPLTLSFEHFGPYRQRQDIDFSTLDDFFLIYGKTGSGKTTIFDAIAYALYGEAVGGRSTLERELASRFSPAGSKPWVEFAFFASSSRWKVYRSLPYRKQNRKGKETEAAGEVALYRMNGEEKYELLADRPTTANQSLLELLRLSADEFSKIVLLPQGEFQQFLEMKTTERVEILEKLFDVRLYDEVTETARRKVLQLDSSLKAKNEELERLANELGTEPDARIAASEKALLDFDVRIEAAARDASLLETEIAQKSERLAFWQSLLAAWKAFSEIEQSKPAFDERQKRLEAAKTLAALGNLARQAGSQRDELVLALGEALRTGTELARLESDRSEIEATQEKLPHLREEQDGLQRRAALYQKALEAWRQKAGLERQRQDALQRLSTATEQCARQEQTIVSLKNSIAGLDTVAAGEPGAQEGLQKNLLAGEALKRIKDLVEQEEKIGAQRSETLRKTQSAEDSLLSADRDLAAAEKNRDRMDEELRHARAGILAASLVAGEPCPVCGSREHPTPAGLPENAPNEETFKKAQEAVETIRSSRAALIQKKENLESRLQEFMRELETVARKISDEWKAQAGAFPGDGADISIDAVSRDTIESIGARLESRRGALEGELKNYRDARGRLQQTRGSLDKAERDYARIQKEKAALEIACAELEARLSSFAEQAGNEDPQPRLEETQERLVVLQKEISRAEARAQEWQVAYGAANAEIEIRLATIASKGEMFIAGFGRFLDETEKVNVGSLFHVLKSSEGVPPPREPHPQIQPGHWQATEASIRNALVVLARSVPRTEKFGPDSRRLTDLAQSFEVICSSHATSEEEAFDLIGDVLDALWSQDRIREEEKALSMFRESYARTRASYEALAARAQPLSPLELEQEERALIGACAALAERKKALDASGSELRGERARLGAELERLRQQLSRAESLKNAYAAAVQEFGRQEKLARLLSGSLNPQRKMPFKNYVLGLQFREIAARASERLYRMSSGRYIVEADILSGSGNQKIGLELFVIDAWNGARRPVGTLSGGEKFMLAISLALGLADSIQERAGAQRIESLFIDEGFGSLDEESLSLAISVLDELRGDKTIAIISHVDELCSRIPSRIVVKKGVSGSRLEFERD
jgi:exonuclease SbcC